MKNGDVIFFKTAKTGSHRKAETVAFKGHGFGVLLGHVPPFQKDPPAEHLLRLMGQIGFLTFDNVGEFLGDEMAQKCVTMFEDKFYGKKLPEAETKEEVAPEQSSLLNVDGQPMLPTPIKPFGLVGNLPPIEDNGL